MKFFNLVLISSLCFSPIGFAQEAGKENAEAVGVDPRFEGFSEVYGILVNVEVNLDAIEKQHPQLKDEVGKVRKDLADSPVGKGFAGVVAAMKEMMGEEFTGFEAASRKQILDLGQTKDLNGEMAKLGLENIAKIKEGNLPTEILRTIISMNPEYRKNPLKEFQDGWVAGFSTKMDLEERKVHFLLRYPGSWVPVASTVKSALFTADNDAGFGNARLALRVGDAPDPKYAKMDPVELAKLLVPPGGNIVESRKVKMAGLPAAVAVYELLVEGAEVPIRQMAYTVYAKEMFVTILVSLDPRGGLDLEEGTKRLTPLLDEMAGKLEID